MNWNQIEGNWKQFKGIAKQQWGKLTDDQLDVISDWQGRQKETDQSKTDQPKSA